MSLPRYVVLNSNYNKQYLRYIHEDGEVRGLVQFSGSEAVSPYAKFEVEQAKTGGGMVHLRCCYNNKYLTSWPQDHQWIAAGAHEPEEDQSKWSCTLFKPVFAEIPAPNLLGAFPATPAQMITVRLLHVHLGHYACLWRAAAPFSDCLFAGVPNTDNDGCDVFGFQDWESLLVLPKHVAFKGDNGRYLKAIWDSHPYLEFSAGDLGDPTVGHQIFTTPDGSVRIKSDHFNKFWRRSPNWIWADSDDTSNNNPDTLFQPVKVGNNVVALRNWGNYYFCKRLTIDGMSNCLNADVPTIVDEAKLVVEELVISREIYNVKFRLEDARTYNHSVLTMATGEANNKTQQPNNQDVKLSYTDKKAKSWKSSVSLKLGVKTKIETGVPMIAEGKIEISAEFSGAYEWGQTEEQTSAVETTYRLVVPPMSTVKVNLIATRASCDVPFSYTQRDVLTNGEYVTYEMNDGLYTGLNSYNFQYDTQQKAL